MPDAEWLSRQDDQVDAVQNAQPGAGMGGASGFSELALLRAAGRGLRRLWRWARARRADDDAVGPERQGDGHVDHTSR